MREKKNKVSVSVSVVFSIEKSIWFKRTNMWDDTKDTLK
jgi:hypothetical protein